MEESELICSDVKHAAGNVVGDGLWLVIAVKLFKLTVVAELTTACSDECSQLLSHPENSIMLKCF